jgi:hypothetical protein
MLHSLVFVAVEDVFEVQKLCDFTPWGRVNLVSSMLQLK